MIHKYVQCLIYLRDYNMLEIITGNIYVKTSIRLCI